MPNPKRFPGAEILDYRHKGAKRKNNPEDGLATYLPEEHATKRYQYDPHLDPQLIWAGKAEHNSFSIPVVPLHIHERITPKSIASLLRRRNGHQLKLFDEGEYPLEKRIDFYKHEVDWANRLILGDSLLVMNSLLTKELMGGKVQTIYVDPPYGISYSSNFQPTISNREVKEGDDESLTRELEQIKAFRDTWELGIHSYLTYLRDRLLLCRELLADPGSIFMQISDQNIHHVRELMDEIFGKQNFVTQITFVKTGAQTDVSLPTIVDYLLWYAKDKETMKVNPLFIKKEITSESTGQYPFVELADGERRRLTQEEVRNPRLLPIGSRLYQLQPLHSQHVSRTRSVPFEFKGRKFIPPPNRQWATSPEGMERLAQLRRIEVSGNTIRYVRYFDEFAASPLANVWTDTSTFIERMYVVQTNTKVIERCVLLSTDPGDLILDPTCGSGTAAYVAEQWGRRWITCDTSRVSLALARQRILTAVYPYYRLSHPEEGLKSGFDLETVQHITLKSIAQNEPPQLERLHDKPKIDKSVVRVAGPFTVEGIPAPSVDTSEGVGQSDEKAGAGDYISSLIEAVRKSGVVFPGGKKLKLENVTPLSSAGFIHAEGLSNSVNKVAISFGPRYGPIGVSQTEAALRTATANGYTILILAGFSFDPGALAFVEKTPLKLQIQFAHINPDMEIHDLLKQTQGSQVFTVFGEPDIEVAQDSSGKYIATLRGVDVYDPTTGLSNQTSAEDLPAWFLDEDYDGFSFNISQALFPNGATRTNPWDKLENALRGTVDKEKIEQFRGTESLPFEKGSRGTIAVKVIDFRGNEVVKLIKLQDGK